MSKPKPWWMTAAFIVALLSVGWSFWLIPYNRLSLPSAVYGPGLVVIFILSLMLRASGIGSFIKVLNVMAATVPAAVLMRIIVEGIMDPTTHNLWPLELIIAAGTGYLVATPGVLMGQLLCRWNANGGQDSKP